MKVLAIGHATLDLFFKLPKTRAHEVDLPSAELCLPFPEKIMIREMESSLGGNAPNVGAGLIKLGHKVSLLAEIGENFLGDATLALLQEVGFDLKNIQRGTGSDLSVILTYLGERTILSHHPPEREWSFKLDKIEVDAVYLSSLGTPKFQGLHAALISWLRNPSSALRHPPSLFYNPGKDELDAGIEDLPILEHTHVLYVNKQEAARLLGQEIAQDAGADRVERLAAEIYRSGPEIVIITDAENGSYGYDGDDLYHQPVFPTRVIERTGAGDAFASGATAAFLRGEDLPLALRWGSAQAHSVIRQTGAINGLLTIDKMFETLGQHERK